MLLDGRKYSKQLLNFAADLGAGVLVVHPHTPAKPEHRDLLEQPVIDNLLWLADRCEDKGILLAMENHPKPAPPAPSCANISIFSIIPISCPWRTPPRCGRQAVTRRLLSGICRPATCT